jgi:hypothetical protein
MPERIQLSRKKGWRMPPNTVKVARGRGFSTREPGDGGWGNPFIVGTPGVPDAATAVRLFREWIEGCISPDYPEPECTRAALEELRGKNLACWCALDKPCHADVLLELANKTPSQFTVKP